MSSAFLLIASLAIVGASPSLDDRCTSPGTGFESFRLSSTVLGNFEVREAAEPVFVNGVPVETFVIRANDSILGAVLYRLAVCIQSSGGIWTLARENGAYDPCKSIVARETGTDTIHPLNVQSWTLSSTTITSGPSDERFTLSGFQCVSTGFAGAASPPLTAGKALQAFTTADYQNPDLAISVNRQVLTVAQALDICAHERLCKSVSLFVQRPSAIQSLNNGFFKLQTTNFVVAVLNKATVAGANANLAGWYSVNAVSQKEGIEWAEESSEPNDPEEEEEEEQREKTTLSLGMFGAGFVVAAIAGVVAARRFNRAPLAGMDSAQLA